MQILNKLIIIGLVVLSIAAGVPKILRAPQELAFLQGIGFSELMVVVLGFAQVIGGGLLAFPASRLIGSVLVAAALLISTIAVFVGGQVEFAVATLMPLVMTCFIMFDTYKARE